MVGRHAAQSNSDDRFDSDNTPAPAEGGFVPLTRKLGASGPRHMPSSLSVRSIKDRLRGQGVKQGGQGVINDLVDELNDGIRPTDDYSMRSVLQTLHSDLSSGRQTIDFDIVREEAAGALERLKATLPEKKQKRSSARSRSTDRARRPQGRPRNRG